MSTLIGLKTLAALPASRVARIEFWPDASSVAGLQLVAPKEATQEMLLDVHTQGYLDSLNSSPAQIASVGLGMS